MNEEPKPTMMEKGGRAYTITSWVLGATVGLILLTVGHSSLLSWLTGEVVPVDAGLVSILGGMWLIVATTAIAGPNASNVTERWGGTFRGVNLTAQVQRDRVTGGTRGPMSSSVGEH